MQPASIGPFKVERELGRGGIGEVYLARDTRLDRQVAIKALPAHLAQDTDRLARFQREAKVLASLNHPGIGAIYGLEEADAHQYLILEFVEGETLADRLAKGAIPVDEALNFAKQVAEPLEVAHEKGVIHRGLKPGNVMVTHDGVVKVLDFGLARTEEGTPSSVASKGFADSPTVTSPARMHSPTIRGVIMGTAGYMSPEQARGKPVDKRSDIFSFGCVLYEMPTGVMPFRGETVADAIGATPTRNQTSACSHQVHHCVCATCSPAASQRTAGTVCTTSAMRDWRLSRQSRRVLSPPFTPRRDSRGLHGSPRPLCAPSSRPPHGSSCRP